MTLGSLNLVQFGAFCLVKYNSSDCTHQVVPRKRPDGCQATRATLTECPSMSATGSSLLKGHEDKSISHVCFLLSLSQMYIHRVCANTQTHTTHCYFIRKQNKFTLGQTFTLPLYLPCYQKGSHCALYDWFILWMADRHKYSAFIKFRPVQTPQLDCSIGGTRGHVDVRILQGQCGLWVKADCPHMGIVTWRRV